MRATLDSCVLLVATVLATSEAQSQGPAASSPEQGASSEVTSSVRDMRNDVPNVAYAYSANGAWQHTVGAQAYTLALIAKDQDGVLGGGGAVWGVPVRGLTLIADAQRNVSRNFSPSLGAIVTLFGDRAEGFSLGALGKFKIDGFAGGPSRDEVESEAEIGALLSYASGLLHVDLNAIAGAGLGDDGETDAEARLRIGGDLGRLVRIGVDSQVRRRLAGPRDLPNGRSWDFAAGPQILIQQENFFGSATVGPTTMGLSSKDIGMTAMLSLGGTTF